MGRKVTGTRYSIINHTGEVKNLHDFIVDWRRCKVSELNQDYERGAESIIVEVCQPGQRLVMHTDFRTTGYSIRYDWVVLDDGKTLAGSYRDPSSCGPSVGKRVK